MKMAVWSHLLATTQLLALHGKSKILFSLIIAIRVLLASLRNCFSTSLFRFFDSISYFFLFHVVQNDESKCDKICTLLKTFEHPLYLHIPSSVESYLPSPHMAYAHMVHTYAPQPRSILLQTFILP